MIYAKPEKIKNKLRTCFCCGATYYFPMGMLPAWHWAYCSPYCKNQYVTKLKV